MSPDRHSFAAQAARLRAVLPRGRIVRDLDLTAIVVPRSKPFAGCHLFEQAPERLIGVSYAGRPERFLRRLGGLVVRHLRGDGEGILHVAWTPEIAERLPWFCLGRQRGTPPRRLLSAGEASP